MEGEIPLSAIIKSGVVSQVVKFLEAGHSEQLQLEAARVLTALGTHCMLWYPTLVTEVVIEYDLVKKFVDLLNSPNDDIRTQAVLALGRFAGRGNDCRGHVIQQEDLLSFLGGLKENDELSLQRSTVWTLLMFFTRTSYNLHLSRIYIYQIKLICQVNPALTALLTLVYSNDEEVLINACEVLSYLSPGENDNIQDVIDADVCQRLLDRILIYMSVDVSGIRLLQYSCLPSVQLEILFSVGASLNRYVGLKVLLEAFMVESNHLRN
ncbi:hypothetical protein K7X08_017597 [Anisodus acutangulus]|uniref:Uncharacterized protein n=1 Tax=Anisodus acutangulus TaxID=402998 RepID=A0A9Q1LXM0_9SOLA|nr:hypothetical protein K7X08_017597 [Anisodus acutangulus]